MIKRIDYLKKLNNFKEKELIKVITGLRRSGKSILMKQFIDYLKENGAKDSQIIKINFEEKENEELLDKDKLYKYIIERIKNNKEIYSYIFLDEIQKVKDFQIIIDSLYVKKNVDIYITGSNADLLSSELATLLTGRYVEIKMLPLSYKEYISDKSDSIELFNDYLNNGGLPYLLNLETNEMKYEYIIGLYNTILNNDIVKRHSDIDLTTFENILNFIIDNTSNIVSPNSIANTLNSYGKKVSYNTVEKYIRYMKECYLIYECNRYNILGKQNLKTLSKYYLVDLGFKKVSSIKNNTNLGYNIENIVYLELLRRGNIVNVGKVNDLEVDFVIKKENEIEYYQVSTSLYDEKTKVREINSLKSIKDNYKKTILTLDDYGMGNVDGINIVNLREWLLEYE
ncbi:MAG: ATP-binding protein [Lachnospiraceae bacterium]|nr:ATP-binding protein [Lachnospiraceae bacterium]